MNDGDKGVLKRFHQKLASDINVDEELLGELFSEDVFERGMIGIIRSQPTPAEKIQKLLELLPKRGPDALAKFIKVIGNTYPWLAKSLIGAGATTSQSISQSSKYKNAIKRLSIDRDINQIVGAFVHRQFGHSKKIPERDKKAVQNFLSDQIQGERNRYQRLLYPPCETPEPSRSATPEDIIFTGTEISKELFSIHTKFEPFLNDCDMDLNDIGGDDDGHPNYRIQQRPKNGQDRQRPKLLPMDMDFGLIHGEIDMVLSQIDNLKGQIKSLSGQINDCLHYFNSNDSLDCSLYTLVGRVIRKCTDLEEESIQDWTRMQSLLNERDAHSDKIARLEREREELKRQIQVVYMDMGSLRAKNKELEQNLAVATKQRQSEIRHTQRHSTSTRTPLRR